MVDEASVKGEGTAPEEAEPSAHELAQIRAFEAIIAANHDEMARVAFIVSEAPGPAQDAVRSAWVRVWRSLRSPTPPPAERRRDWLLGLAATEARHLAEAGYSNRDDAPGVAGVSATHASAAAAYRSDELELANAMAALDPHDRMIVALRYVGGLDADAIGRELNIPDRAVLARIARILKGLVGEERLAGMPSQTVADFEGALAERIRALTERALMPFDRAEVAKGAIESPPEPAIAEQLEELLRKAAAQLRVLDWRVWPVVAGVVLFFMIVPGLVGGLSGFGFGVSSTPVPNDAKRLCGQDELAARLQGWESSGGDWIASVSVRNVSSGACLIDSMPEASLVDAGGNTLMTGQGASSNSTRIGPGDTLRTKVQVHNYCGAAPAVPVTIVFRSGTLSFRALPTAGDPNGVPACAGGGSGSVSMQPWAP